MSPTWSAPTWMPPWPRSHGGSSARSSSSAPTTRDEDQGLQHFSNQLSVWWVNQKTTMGEKRLCVASGNQGQRLRNGGLQRFARACSSAAHRLLDLGEGQLNR